MDIVILAVLHCHAMNAAELWVAFGTGKLFRYISAHELHVNLDPQKLMFHSFTECDTVSFVGKGKATAWEVWRVYPDRAHKGIFSLSTGPHKLPDTCLERLEFCCPPVWSYQSDQQSEFSKTVFVVQAGMHHWEHSTPTRCTQQHVLLSRYQGGCIWGKCIVPVPYLPSPADWGWQKEKTDRWQQKPGHSADQHPWIPLWSALEQAEWSWHELIRWYCKQGCRKGQWFDGLAVTHPSRKWEVPGLNPIWALGFFTCPLDHEWWSEC